MCVLLSAMHATCMLHITRHMAFVAHRTNTCFQKNTGAILYLANFHARFTDFVIISYAYADRGAIRKTGMG